MIFDAPDLYHNDASGTVEPKGRKKLKTAVEVAAATPPPPPRGSLAMLPDLPPCQEDVENLSACNGRSRSLAIYTLQERIKAQQVKQRTLCPKYAAATEALHTVGIKALTEASQRVRSQAGKIGEIETLLAARGELRREAAAQGSSLESAKATLENGPVALALSGEELVRLTTQVKHLPARIRELQGKACEHGQRIRLLVDSGEIDLPALVEDMLRRTDPPPGSVVTTDRNLRSLIEGGWFALSDKP